MNNYSYIITTVEHVIDFIACFEIYQRLRIKRGVVARMKYLTYGDKKNKSVVLIHGMATTAATCFDFLLDYLKEYYVVLVEVDGHIPEEPDSVLKSFPGACEDIERYIQTELDGHVYCIGGLSMGASMTVEIMGRNHIKADKAFLDGAFIVKMGPVLKNVYTSLFTFFAKWLQNGHSIPQFIYDNIYDKMFGKGNRGIVDGFYLNVRKETLKTVCHFVYSYTIHEEIKEFAGEALFIYGSYEPYAKKGAKLLKAYLPSLTVREIEGMGHGQYLYNHHEEYARDFLAYLGNE